jgi:hypothetical protein
VVTQVGLDLDHGVLSPYRGSIVKLLPGHNALYALVDATLEKTRDLYPAGEEGNTQFYDNEGFSAVFKWKSHTTIAGERRGWSVISLGGAAATPITTGMIATADGIHRLWFGLDNTVYNLPLQVTIQNPLELADFPYATDAEDISPWFDKDNAVVDALATSVSVYMESTSSTEYLKLYYGLNGDDDTWTLLSNDAFTDGQIDADGEALFILGDGAGKVFNSIRFKRELFRGSTNTKSPDCRWLRLSYLKLLPTRARFQVQVDCARNYRHKSARSMLALLKTAQDIQTLGEFQFKEKGTGETHYVKIEDMVGAEIGGRKSESVFNVTLIAP